MKFIFVFFIVLNLSNSFSQKFYGHKIIGLPKLELIADTVFDADYSVKKQSEPKITDIVYKRNFVRYNNEKGFPDPFCYEICEDNYGQLWIGTDREGVCVFNGDRFRAVNKSKGLYSNHVKTIGVSQSGVIWLGTYAGIELIENGKVKDIKRNRDRIKERVRDVLVLNNKEALVSYQSSGLFLIKIKADSLIYSSVINTEAFVDNLVLNNNKLIFSIKNKLFESEYIHERLSFVSELENFSNEITQIRIRNNDIYVSTTLNLYCVNKSKETEQILSSSFNVNDFIFDKNTNSIYVATYYNGLLEVNNDKSIKHVDLELSTNLIYSLYFDKNSNLWVSTGGEGIVKLTKSKFELLDLNNEFIQMVDFDNSIYAGTDKGYSVIKEDKVYSYSQINDVNSTVWEICSNANGELWFSTYGSGVFYLKDNKYHFLNSYNELSDFKSYSICFGPKGECLIGGYNGFSVLKNGKIFMYSKKSGLPENKISKITKGLNDVIYIALENNVIIYFKNNYYDVTNLLGIDCSVEAIYEFEKYIFFLTDEGVKILNKKDNAFINLNTDKGLTNNFTNALVQISTHVYLVGTNNGITEVDLSKGCKVKTYDYKDGFSGIATNSGGGLLKNGRIYWGTVKGLVIQNVKNEKSVQKKEAKLIIDKIEVDFKEINIKELNLIDYDSKYITFKYHSIDLTNYKKVKYSYFIEGFSDEWSPWLKNEEITLSNLPLNQKLVLRIKVKNSSYIISEELSLEFFIPPPFWKEKWFVFVILVALILIFIINYRAKMKRLKERQNELENEVENATYELRAQKEKVEQQKEQVEEAHKEITDSISYAERIQRSFLATKEILNENLSNYFVFFQPKDIVSGDFYWAEKLQNGQFAIVNADSTGHGVPGAIMSILNISSIEKAVNKGLLTPTDIFNDTRRTIIERLRKDGSVEGGKDGMDAIIICFDFEKMKISYVAAQNPIWIIRDKEVIQIKPEKMPIGKHDNDNVPFSGGEYDIKKGDKIYTLTDGFQDQFGGEKGKKFMIKKMRSYVLSISHLPMTEQRERLKNTFNSWKGSLEQVDDICVIGIEV